MERSEALATLSTDPDVLAFGVGGSTAYRDPAETAPARDYDAVLLVRDLNALHRIVHERSQDVCALLGIECPDHKEVPPAMGYQILRFIGYTPEGLKRGVKIMNVEHLLEIAVQEESTVVRMLAAIDRRIFDDARGEGNIFIIQQLARIGYWSVMFERDMAEAEDANGRREARFGIGVDLMLTAKYFLNKENIVDRLFKAFARKLVRLNPRPMSTQDFCGVFRRSYKFSPIYRQNLIERIQFLELPTAEHNENLLEIPSEIITFKIDLNNFLSVPVIPPTPMRAPEVFIFDSEKATSSSSTPSFVNDNFGRYENSLSWKNTSDWKTELANLALLAPYFHDALIFPLSIDTEAGVLVYPWIEGPTLAELRLQYEQSCGGGHSTLRNRLLAAEMRRCELTLRAYCHSAVLAQPHGHLLNRFFHERLRPPTRLVELLPQGVQLGPTKVLSLSDLRRLRVHVNGTALGTLDDRLAQAERVLSPAALDGTLSVLGLGDAHGGNILLRADNDIRFLNVQEAGRHSPWLDLAIPLFNDLLLNLVEKSEAEWEIDGINLYISFPLQVDELTEKLYHIRKTFLIEPFLEFIQMRGWINNSPTLWKELLGKALLCCAILSNDISGDVNNFVRRLAVGMLLAPTFDFEACTLSQALQRIHT